MLKQQQAAGGRALLRVVCSQGQFQFRQRNGRFQVIIQIFVIWYGGFFYLNIYLFWHHLFWHLYHFFSSIPPSNCPTVFINVYIVRLGCVMVMDQVRRWYGLFLTLGAYMVCVLLLLSGPELDVRRNTNIAAGCVVFFFRSLCLLPWLRMFYCSFNAKKYGSSASSSNNVGYGRHRYWLYWCPQTPDAFCR